MSEIDYQVAVTMPLPLDCNSKIYEPTIIFEATNMNGANEEEF